MVRINNESELIRRLQEDVKSCEKDLIVLQAGHFPILFLLRGPTEGISPGFNPWGQFSQYSLELGCEIGKFAGDIGKNLRFAFFVDDHSYEKISGLTDSEVFLWRDQFYKERNGPNANLPQLYKEIMARFGFNKTDVLRHNHKKPGREDCLYFSEKVLRSSAKEIENACAREYTEFIENPEYFDKKSSHLISFVPNRCKGHICEVALKEEIEGLSASHIFMETMNPLATREELYLQGRGVTYRRD